ncbi:MAG: phage holin family protein [Lentihominibacter sp.]
MEIIIVMYQNAAHNTLLQLVVIAVICDTVFGVLRAIREKKFNSNFGIDGAIRKIGMILSLVFMVISDAVIEINLIGFVPEEARSFLGIEAIGVAEFFALLYIAYEVISIIKNMALCGLPVKSIWVKARTWLGKYTDDLPAGEEETKSK